MPELVQPDVRFQASFLAAMRDFVAEGRGAPDDDSALGNNIRKHGLTWGDPDGFAAFVTDLRTQGDPSLPPPIGWVKQTTWWYVEGEEYLGTIRIRHSLTPDLLNEGGHIGYDVAPAHRRKGHGTAMLAAALPHAYALGIDPVLITCDHDNVASARIIETNGGRFADQRSGKLRFWVRTSPSDEIVVNVLGDEHAVD